MSASKLFAPLLIPFFVGNSVSTALWGVSCCQTWHYLMTAPRDSIYIKTMVGVIWLADTAHQLLVTSALYNYTIANFMDPFKLIMTPTGTPAQLAMMQLIMSSVQGFYTYKIYRLSGNKWWLVAPIILLGLSEIGLCIVNIRIDAIWTTWFAILERTKIINVAFGAICFVTDFIIATLMCYTLHAHRAEFSRTKSIIKKLTVFTFSTNLLTSMCAFVTLVLIVVYPSQAYFLPVFHAYVRIYTNSFMAALNMRAYFSRTRSGPVMGSEFNMPTLPSSDPSSTRSDVIYAIKPDETLDVYVSRQTYSKTDSATLA